VGFDGDTKGAFSHPHRPKETVVSDRPEWFEVAFGSHYVEVYARRDARAAWIEVDFARTHLGLEAGDRVLDLCCGPGHHLAALRACGIVGVGVDLSRELLRLASRRGPVARADMRQVPYAGPFTAVLSFFTSFGYFDDCGNELALAETSRLLSPGGGFLVDYLNPPLVRRTLAPDTSREVSGRAIRERRWIEGDPPRVFKEVEVTPPSGERVCYTESVRLYEEPELREMLCSAGLAVTGVHGDFDGSAYAPDSPRMIVVGRKSAPPGSALTGRRREGQAARRHWKGGRRMFMQISVGGDRNFAYLFGANGVAAAVDPLDPGQVERAARAAGVEIRYIVNTHGHYDHADGNDELKRRTGAAVVVHEAAAISKDIAVHGGERFELGGAEFEILATPGHTPDSVCVLWDGRLVTGDTLFVGKVGGTDLGEGARQEYESLHRVIGSLPDQTEVWPGHDVGVEPGSTVGLEKETNPFYLQPDLESFVALKRNWAEYKREHGIR